MWIISFFKENLTTLLFPPVCASCGTVGEDICLDCLSSFKRSIDTEIPDTYSYFSYKDPRVRSILQKIKYFRRYHLVEPLVKKISKDLFLREFLNNEKSYVLVPIPMSRKRFWQRGGNHTEVIAKAFSDYLNIPIEKSVLVRRKDTLQQVLTHSKQERLRNVRKSFGLDDKKLHTIAGKTIILIDDVTTTGATLHEAKKTLEKVGFKNINAITLAH